MHLAQIFTTFISGLAHHSFGNVDTRVTARLAGAGSVGAFVGAALLATVPSSAARAISATLLSGMGTHRPAWREPPRPTRAVWASACAPGAGAYVFYRFHRAESTQSRPGAPSLSLLVPLGLAGGFVDATGGGGWGPVATSGLLADHRLSPTRVIGTVSASEFFVTVAAVLGFFGSSVGLADGAEPDAPPALRLELVAMLILGGVVAAPVAPLLVVRIAPRVLGQATPRSRAEITRPRFTSVETPYQVSQSLKAARQSAHSLAL